MTKKPIYTTLAHHWHAVSILGGSAPCPAALAVRQKRFLSAEAPRLPLNDCTSPGRCQCRYQHHADRRVTIRRMLDRGGLPFPWSSEEKRGNRQGRRTSDMDVPEDSGPSHRRSPIRPR